MTWCRCQGCNHLIGKGVRFNAEKKAIGNYHSTKIWAFTMRAPCCQRRIEIHTDPKNTRYNIVEGAKEKVGLYPLSFCSSDRDPPNVEVKSEG